MDFRPYLQQEPVRSVGYRPTVSVGSEATIGQAIELMQARRVGCLLILDAEDGLLGIFTERDVLRKVVAADATLGLEDRVGAAMTPAPVTVRTDEALAVLFGRMFRGGFRHIPAMSPEGRLLGTVSIKRVVSFLADQFPETVYNLPPDPERFGSAREGA
ncbi:MAG: CBS domain-containing protein [Acidobacteriota bacterium]|nr:CBS domain-containing protein [Acidobacteriota bacterium]